MLFLGTFVMAAQKPSWQRSALSQLKHWNPDVVGLSEFRESATSQAIAESLAGIGLTYQQTTVGAPEGASRKLLKVEKWSPEGDDVALRN